MDLSFVTLSLQKMVGWQVDELWSACCSCCRYFRTDVRRRWHWVRYDMSSYISVYSPLKCLQPKNVHFQLVNCWTIWRFTNPIHEGKIYTVRKTWYFFIIKKSKLLLNVTGFYIFICKNEKLSSTELCVCHIPDFFWTSRLNL